MSMVAGTSAQFVHEICESPGEDGLRLIYADWLEEHDQPERAEFIRVQCELASMPEPWCKTPHKEDNCEELGKLPLCDWCALRRRERGLLAKNGWRWSPELPDVCWMIGGIVDRAFGTGRVLGAEFRSGFVASVSCSLADWCGRECERCHGTKKARVVDARKQEENKRRGIRVMIPPQAYVVCPACHGTGRTDAHGPALVRAAPLEGVTMTDREPWCSLSDNWDMRVTKEIRTDSKASFWWFEENVYEGNHYHFPSSIMANMPEKGFVGTGKRAWRCYGKKEAQQRASTASLNWARSVAGLPPLP